MHDHLPRPTRHRPGRSRRRACLTAGLLACLALSGGAAAQYTNSWTNPYTGTTWNNPMSSFIDTVIYTNRWQRLTSPGGATAAEAALAAPDPAVNSFRPVPRRLELQEYAASLTTDPAEQAQLMALLEFGFEEYEAAAERLERPHNVAFALTYLIGVSYLVYTEGDEPSEEALEAVWRGTHQMFAEAPEFQRATDRDKQRAYEQLVMSATLPLFGYFLSAEDGDLEAMGAYRELAGQTLESLLGVPAEQVVFTATGLELGSGR